MENKKILTTSWHPSATNMLIPVLNILQKQKELDISIIGTKYSNRVFEKNGFSYLPIESYGLKNFAEANMEKILLKENPDLVLLGASFQEVQSGERYIPDQTMINAARRQGIPSITIHDYWRDMAKYTNKITGRIEFIPDAIAVFDSYAKKKLIEAGLPEQVIKITGNPEADILKQTKENFSDTRKYELKKVFDIKVQDVFLYCGGVEWNKNKSKLGYTTLDNIKIITDSLKDIGRDDLNVIVTLHPRMAQNDESGMRDVLNHLKNCGDSRIKYIDQVYEKGFTMEELALASNAVFTAFSTVAIKGAWMGKPCMSLQPNLILPNDFTDGEIGFFLDHSNVIPLGKNYKEAKDLVIKMFTDKKLISDLEKSLVNCPDMTLQSGSQGIMDLIKENIN